MAELDLKSILGDPTPEPSQPDFPASIDKSRLQKSLSLAIGNDTHSAARAYQLSKQTGLPMDTVERNTQEVENAQRMRTLDLDSILKDAPRTAEYLSNPDNARQAHNDVEKLYDMETALRKIRESDFDASVGTEQMPKLAQFSKEEQKGFFNNAARLIAQRAGDLGGGFLTVANQVGDALNAQFPMGGFVWNGESIVPDYVSQSEFGEFDGYNLIEDTANTLTEFDIGGESRYTWEGVKETFGDNSGVMDKMGEVFGFAMEQGIASLPDMFAVVMNMPAYVISRAGEIGQERAANKGKQAADIGDTIEALPFATGSALLERLGADAIKDAGIEAVERVGNKALKAYILYTGKEALKAGAVEGGTEFVQEGIIEYLGSNLGTGRDMSTVEAVDRGLAGLVAGGIYGGGAATLTGTVNTARDRYRRQADITAFDQARLNALSKGFTESELRKNNADAFRELVKSMASDTDIQMVLVDPQGAQTFFQGMKLEEQPEAVQSIMEDIPAAIEEGRSIEIPVETFATDIAGTEFETGLKPYMKLDPDALTPFEAQDRDVQAEIRALASMTGEQLAEEAQVYNDVYGQLISIGQSDSTANQYAMLHEAFFRTMAKRAGMSPMELYQQYGLGINRQIDPALQEQARNIDTTDVMLDRLRNSDIPEDQDIFGKSLTQFIVDNGGLLDEGGELAARDANAGRVGSNTIYRSNGRSLDDVAEIAVEAGYIKDRTEDALLEAIDRELRGEPVYASGAENAELQNIRTSLEQLQEILDRAEIDINAMDNLQIKQALLGEQEGDVLTQAQAVGYEGADAVEASEWLRARAKGLDMSQEARMQRARDMGFDVDTVYYHGSPDIEPIKDFNSGSFFTDDPEYAAKFSDSSSASSSFYGATGGSPGIAPVFLKTGNIFDTRKPEHRDIYERYYQGQFDAGADITPEGLPDWVEANSLTDFFTEEMPDLGFDGFVVDEGMDASGARPPAIVVVNNNAVRSTHAAFDPDFSDSPNLLAQRQAQTQSAEFKRWFGDSKVVDENGEPLVVYHGTISDFDSFNGELSGSVTGAESAKLGFFFTDSTEAAESYANYAATDRRVQDILAEADEAERAGNWGLYDQKIIEAEELEATFADPQERLNGQNNMPVYLSLKKPLEIDAGGESYMAFEEDITAQIRDAKEQGYDGVIIRNLDDAVGLVNSEADHFVVFNPEQIKSAVGNKGNFDPNNPSILEQFAGVNSQTADLHNLEVAQQQIESGRSPEVVRRETGWHKGVDGKWRYEISDADASFTTEPDTGEYVLSDLIEHENLFAAYPAMRSMPVSIVETLESRGMYMPTQNRIMLHSDLDTEQKLSTLLHEVQHAIQEREDFGRGGAPDEQFTKRVKTAISSMSNADQNSIMSWQVDNYSKLKQAEQASEKARMALLYESAMRLVDYSHHDRPSSVFRHIRGESGWLYSEIFQKGDLRERVRDLERKFYNLPKRHKMQERNAFLRDYSMELSLLMREAIPDQLLEQFKADTRKVKSMVKALERQSDKARKELAELNDLKSKARNSKQLEDATQYKSPYDVYRALAGEIEARNTQARQSMTDAERQDTSPDMTADVPREEAIVLFNGGEIQAPAPQSIMPQNEGTPRGFFNRTTNQITLTPKADLSTFLHESGHFFLEAMRGLRDRDASIDEDLKSIERWAATQGAKTDRDVHEMFASGFETYLMEGKAPTPELQGMFARFKAWLSLVYKQITNVFVSNNLGGIQLSNEVRGVMDRMLATEEAIEQASNQQGNLGPNEMQALGLSEEEAAEYQRMVNAARDEADRNLTTDIMQEMQRERKKWWRDGVDAEAEKVRDEINAQAVYQARDFLSGSSMPDGMQEVKLSTSYIRDIYGKQAGRKLNRMTAQNGSHPDRIAGMFGFKSGDELVRALLGSMNRQERENYIRKEAEQRMRDLHGDMLTDGTLDEQAQKVLHNDRRADLLLAELRWLNRSAGQKEAPRQYFKSAAEAVLAMTPINEVRPDVHRRNEIKARNNALKAAATGDYRTAALNQHQAVRQFYLYREAMYVKEQAESHRKRLQQMSKTKYNAREVDPAYIQQLKVLVAAFDLRKSPKDSEARLAQVNKFIQAQKEANPDLIADTFLESITSWKEMTLDDLMALRDAAENMLTIGKRNSAAEKQRFEESVTRLVTNIEDNIDKPKKRLDDRSGINRARKSKAQFAAIHRKLESLLQEADGWQDNGPAQELIFRPLYDAQITEVERLAKEHAELAELFEGFEYLFSGMQANMKDLGLKTDTYEMPVGTEGVTLSLTRGERIVLALNYGNEGNREALREQTRMQMSDAGIMSAIGTLTKEELELVNRIWEYVDKFYPELAKVEQEATGVAPQKVEADPFFVNGVQMRGGYYPLQADSSLSWKAEMHAVEERAEKLKQGGSVRASTKHGSTIERIGFGRQPVNLSIDGLFKHVDGVVHDLTHRKAVREVDRLARSEAVREAMIDAIGQEGYKAVNDALTRLAGGNTHPSDLAILNKAMRFSRVAVSYGAMGYSVGTAMLNMTGFLPAIPEVGKVRMMSSLFKEMFNPLSMGREIKEKSVFMDNRAQTINRDVYAILRDIKGNTKWNNFKQYAFWMIQKVDAFVSRAVWDAAYNKAVENGKAEQDAIFEADRTVARTQGTGLKIDLSAVEDQSEVYRALSPMYTYFNAVLNLSIRQSGKAKTGQMGKLQLMENMFWIFIATAMVEEFIRGAADDDEMPEETAERYAKATGSYYLGQWFGVRELSGFVRYGQMFDTPLQSTLSAPFKVGKEAIDLGFDPDAEFDKSTLRATTDLLPVLGFPSGVQINRTMSYLMDVEESGEDVSPYKLLVTGKTEDTDVERIITE